MSFDISVYKTIVFDCDGVIFDSNKIKSEAFYSSVEKYGDDAARSLVEYHMENGGISRYKKFDYFFSKILGRKAGVDELEKVVNIFSEKVTALLMACEATSALPDLKKKCFSSKWMVVSGGDQEELRNVFKERGISSYFCGGIFGSPDTKRDIISREIKLRNIELPAIYLGDSRYDFEESNVCGLDFCFVSAWTEFADWREYFEGKSVRVVDGVSSLV